MNIKEIESLIQENSPKLYFKSDYSSGNTSKPYKAISLSSLREAINSLSEIDLIKPEIDKLKNSTLYNNYKDEDIFDVTDHTLISSNVMKIRTGLEFLLRYNQQNEAPKNGLFIRLPDIATFDDLERTACDLKKAIEIPINDQNQGGSIKIVSAESGSIWLILSAGTIAAVNLIGAICWSAAVIRKKQAEAKIFEEHARTLVLKNDSISTFVEAQKQQIKNILQDEAEAIAQKHFSNDDPEAIGRLKLSINTVSELIDKGTQILPSADNKEVLKSFPDYSNLSLIESAIKRLKLEN